MTNFFGWLLGLENVTAIDEIDPSLAAPWAQEGPFWVFLAAAALIALAVFFYLRFQPKGSLGARIGLAVSRGLLLALLLLTLADPVLRLTVTNKQYPYLYFVFDGTDSMAIEDEWTEAERTKLLQAVGGRTQPIAVTPTSTAPAGDGQATAPQPVSADAPLSRMALVQSYVGKQQDNLLTRLQDEKKAQLEAFLFDGNTTSQLRKLDLATGPAKKLDPQQLASQLTTKGQVTALGAVVSEVGQQFGSGRLAGVVVFSDFAHNSGLTPVGGAEQSPVAKLGVPIYTVGVGVTEAIDLAVDVQTDPRMKKAERSEVKVKLRQTGLAGKPVNVRVTARKLSGDLPGEASPEIKIGERSVTLEGGVQDIVLPFTPEEAGRFEFVAEVEKLEGEIVDQNNRAARQVNIIDDYLRLMYVAHEPTWEWRFIKEVFHRDKLVGMQGFRTFLASSDPRVRESNVLFLPSLTPKRSEFFANDVLFLDDMPKSALNDRYCEMVKEFVSNLGGGLVVIAGPRFGPRELRDTPLADMLPVLIDPNGELRDAPEHPDFRMKLTPHAARYNFMQLGANEIEDRKAWENMGKLPWYQPVAALHEQAVALAEHPSDKCADGRTPQPLIAIRKYGNGEVVYLAHNEMWRLRRIYGEKYYRQFWSQLIYRLGMTRAIGSDKRFVAQLDAQTYRAEDKVTLTVEAFDENYEPLSEEKLPDRTLEAELTLPGQNGDEVRSLQVPMLRKGVFELRLPVFAVGEYSLRVKDPITGKFKDQRFEVTPLSAERRRGVRDEKMQQDIAQQSGGRSYDLTTANQLVNDLQLEPVTERLTRNHSLWATPLWFIAVIGLMLGEWFSRKLIRLS